MAHSLHKCWVDKWNSQLSFCLSHTGSAKFKTHTVINMLQKNFFYRKQSISTTNLIKDKLILYLLG